MQSLLDVAGFADHYFSNRLGGELLDRIPKEWMIFNYENPANKQVLQICPASMDHDGEVISVTSTRVPHCRIARQIHVRLLSYELGRRPSIRRHGIKSIREQEFLDAGTHDEIEKLFRDRKGCVSTGPYHRFPELDRRIPPRRGFINDAHLPAVDRIHAVDDAHLSLPCANQIDDIITMLRVEKVGPVFIRGIHLCQRPGRDFSQG